MGELVRISRQIMFVFFFIYCLCVCFVYEPFVEGWSKEGHAMTCKIAQELLEPEADAAVKMLLPDYAGGDLSALCVWPDQVRHWYKYRWTSPLHFIDTPDQACNFNYQRDCHDSHGVKDMCVAGAIQNFTNQLSHYRHGTSHDRRRMPKAGIETRVKEGSSSYSSWHYNKNGPGTSARQKRRRSSPESAYSGWKNTRKRAGRTDNMTEALLFLAHFMGDIHQPMHVGFTSDEGGNTINLRWFRHKSNLHRVWDREIILTAAADYYGKDINFLRQDIKRNVTHGIWSDEVGSWMNCTDLFPCVNKYASESINIACKCGYKGVEPGDTLSDKYFNSRMSIVMKRIAQGGVRLAMILNHIFGNTLQDPMPAI